MKTKSLDLGSFKEYKEIVARLKLLAKMHGHELYAYKTDGNLFWLTSRNNAVPWVGCIIEAETVEELEQKFNDHLNDTSDLGKNSIPNVEISAVGQEALAVWNQRPILKEETIELHYCDSRDMAWDYDNDWD